MNAAGRGLYGYTEDTSTLSTTPDLSGPNTTTMLTVALLTLFTLLCVLLSADRAWDNVTKPERNALVFDGRNRNYGAFVLRREYDRRFILAFFGAIGLFATGITVPKILGELGAWTIPPRIPKPPIPDDKKMIWVTIPVEEKEQAQTTRSTTRPISTEVLIPVVPTDSLRTPEPKDTTTVRSDPAPGPVGPPGPPGPPAGPGGGDTGLTEVYTPENPLNPGIVDVVPEFPGGQLALARFIQDNLRVNDDDIIQASEKVIFVVDVDGNVVKVKARGRAVRVFSEAAERVVRIMPKWKPAKYKGKDVPCVMVLPIDYQTR